MAMRDLDSRYLVSGFGNRFHRFQDLMPNRVHDILLVSSAYDAFILEEDGRLDEGLIHEYMDLNLIHLPRMLRAQSGAQALERLVTEPGIDLVICSIRLSDMDAFGFARAAREEGLEVPIVLLSYDDRELRDLVRRKDASVFAKVFLWQGDFRLLLAIVKLVEDRLNVDCDTRLVGVQSIIVIEDNIRYYSAFLPLMYGELMRHSQNVLTESVSLSHRIMRMRARPKLLFCETYEEAWEYFEAYHEDILGVISDIEFPKGGEVSDQAGVEFARNVRAVHPDIPILLQSSRPENAGYAEALGVSFVEKDSPTLLHDVRRFMVENLSFGDFVFRDAGGREVARAEDVRSLERCIAEVPEESLLFHAERNHFSNWLKARTEFWLAHQLRPRRVSDYGSTEELREDIVRQLREFRLRQLRGIVVDYDEENFDPGGGFARIGRGSLGGKGRGLAFASMLLESYGIRELFPGVDISVPAAVVLGTRIFDDFMSRNSLFSFALAEEDDEELERTFLAAQFPEEYLSQLRSLCRLVDYPLAVRSSSLLEDSQLQPFAGIYRTLMVRNNDPDPDVRLAELVTAVKLVYASTYCRRAKAYMRATSLRMEEEKMGVVIQRLVGRRHGELFYPDFSGVARSHNFYPVAPMTSEDGIASVALGLGTTVVEGGATVRFCPRYPRHLIQFSSVEHALAYSQREFAALELNGSRNGTNRFEPGRYGLGVAEEDGTLAAVGSTWSPENDVVYEGIARDGVRLVSFAPMLSGGPFPLAEILKFLLRAGRWSMSTAIEIEFAVNYAVPRGERKEFRLLQMRPVVVDRLLDRVDVGHVARERIVAESRMVLGNGILTDIRDLVFVDLDAFDRARTRDVAREIGLFNHELAGQGRPYVLFGVGRWGSADPWLGIPVAWEDISGARVIVESSFRDLKVTPSQGSHFFQNLATMRVGYFTIEPGSDWGEGFVDWEWLEALPPSGRRDLTRHVRLDEPLTVRMDGRVNHGLILKPDGDASGR